VISLMAAAPVFAQSTGGGLTTSTQQTSGGVTGNGTSGAVQTGAAGDSSKTGAAMSGTGVTIVPAVPAANGGGMPTTSTDQTSGGLKSGASSSAKP
jgi:hypothetical protein